MNIESNKSMIGHKSIESSGAASTSGAAFWHSMSSSVLPGIASTGAIMLGVPPVVAVAGGAVAGGFAFASVVAGRAGAIAVASVFAFAASLFAGATVVAGLAIAAGGIAAGGIAGAAVATVAVVTGVFAGAAVATNGRHSAKKALAGTLIGTALGGALTYGAAVNAPQAPAPAEKPLPPSTLSVETRGGALCKDFKISENTTLSSAQDASGQKTYTLTVPKGCTLE